MSGLDLGICGFSHIGFAVPSVEQFAETWGSVLGIDNWSTHEESASGGVFVDGAPPAPLRVKVAFARAGGLAIEVELVMTRCPVRAGPVLERSRKMVLRRRFNIAANSWPGAEW